MTRGELIRLGWEQAIMETSAYWIRQVETGWWKLARLDTALGKLDILATAPSKHSARLLAEALAE